MPSDNPWRFRVGARPRHERARDVQAIVRSELIFALGPTSQHRDGERIMIDTASLRSVLVLLFLCLHYTNMSVQVSYI